MNSPIFPSTVSARQIQRNYKSILAKVKKTNKPIVVMSNNEPQATIISMDLFNRYTQAESKQDLWDIIASIQAKNRYNDPVATQKDIDEAVEDARQKVYDKYYRSPRQQRANKRSPLTSQRTRKDNQTLARKKIHDDYLSTNG